MFSTQRHNRNYREMSTRRVVQTWVMALVILLAGVTQSGLIPALLTGQATGISQARAADIYPGGNVLLICTPGGIKKVDLANENPDKVPTDVPPLAGHAFCSLCATHHGAVIAVDMPDMAPVAVVHEIRFAKVPGIVTGHDMPRVRHSRAPPAVI
jgi:hypothetical protein